ncbi:MAG: InlB B-repeat-containing protein, partial [Defluviitaleaceae bacterium]|nr:InlB B-repeat-containing protein [Defluviitaleaceae bacterium]
MKNILNHFSPILKSQKARKVFMFVALSIIAAFGVFGYTYNEWGAQGYDYGPRYDEYYPGPVSVDYVEYIEVSHNNIEGPYYSGDAPNYMSFNMVALGYMDVYLGEFETIDFDNSIAAFDDNLYYICIETMGGYLIGPLSGILVSFNPNTPDGLGTSPGQGARSTYYGDADIGWIGDARMPFPLPTHSLGGRAFLGWNTQSDGRGTMFTGTSPVCSVNGVDGNGSFTVYAKWGVTVLFSGNGWAPPAVPPFNANNPQYYGERANIPEGWSINEVSAEFGTMVWVNDPPIGARPGWTFSGWWSVSAAIGGVEMTGNTEIDGPMVIFARWIPNIPPRVSFILPAVNGTAVGSFTYTHMDGATPVTINHTPFRDAMPGMSVDMSSRPAGFGQTQLNDNIPWPRSAPGAACTAGRTLEGWWLEPYGWDALGNTRWSSPGANHTAGATQWPSPPAAFAITPVTDDLDVFAHWVYRVIFNPNGGTVRDTDPDFTYPVPGNVPVHPENIGVARIHRDLRLDDSGGNIDNDGILRNIHTHEPMPRGMPEDCSLMVLYRPGHTFNGWWLQMFHPNQNPHVTHPHLEFTGQCAITESFSVWAHWIPNDDVVVTFNTQGGIWYRNTGSGFTETANPVPIGTSDLHNIGLPGPGPGNIPPPGTIGNTTGINMPTFPHKPGYVMLGWFTSPYYTNGVVGVGGGSFPRGTRFTSSTAVPQNITVYAHWAPYVEVIFVANGGFNTQEWVPPGTLIPEITGGSSPYMRRRVAFGSATAAATHANFTNLPGRLSIGYMNAVYNWAHEGAHTSNITSWGSGPNANNTGGAGFLGGFRRPGYVQIQAMWQWYTGVPAGVGGQNRLAVGNSGVWNTCPDGSFDGRTFHTGSDVSTFPYTINPETGRRELRVYLQWGVPVTFDPNLGFIGQPASRVITMADGYSFDDRNDSRHMRPYPLHPQATFNVPLPFTYAFPNPRQAAQGGNWPEVAALTTDVTFLGWNTRQDRSGRWFTSEDDIAFMCFIDWVYLAPMTLYAQWDNTLSFHHGLGDPTSILSQWRERPFTVGVPLTPWPPEPIDPVGFAFRGWWANNDGTGAQLLAVTNVLGPGTWYAAWGARFNFRGNGGQLVNPLDFYRIATVGRPIGLGSMVPNPSRTGTWAFGRWNDQPDGRGVVYSETAPVITADHPVVELYAQWMGIFRFDLAGGNFGGNQYTAGWDSVVPEFFSINEAMASTVPAIADGARFPNNPAHVDPSMVFTGWRIASGPLAGQMFDPSVHQLNAIYCDDDPDNIITNAPNGLMIIEAIWHQRLVFTKTGEDLYLTYPATNNTTRVAHPRPGAEFRLYRNTGTPASPTWVAVTGNITSGAAANIAAVGTATGNTPFAAAIPASMQPGLVVMNITTPPGRVALTPGGQYRLYEVQPPMGYMREGGYWLINMHPADTHPDARINTITHEAPNSLYFFDWNAVSPNPDMLQNWHVGNHRPRLMFTKYGREDSAGVRQPLNGVQFIVERFNTVTSTWEAMPDAYQPQPSGSAIPHLPGRPAPSPAPPGSVFIPRPFSYNSTGQYRLREVSVPANSGYLIPMFGRWNITTNRYSGVSNITVCTLYDIAPAFDSDPPGPIVVGPGASVEHPRPWDVTWRVYNTPTRYWPILKTDGQVLTGGSFDHEYLPNAVFKLFVWEGTSPPAADRMVMPG